MPPPVMAITTPPHNTGPRHFSEPANKLNAGHNRPTRLARVLRCLVPQMTPTREQILAASAGWVAVVLNVVPGLGAGYLYQRRWRAYWITSAIATAWFVTGAILAPQAEASIEAQNQLIGLIGLLILAAITATEAGLAVRKTRQGS